MDGWTAEKMPPQVGRMALVTGANSGVGFETARGLARAGARVILACRNPEKAAPALDRIASEATGPDPELLLVDLANLDDVRRAAGEAAKRIDRLHVLVNNAGIMGVRPRQLSPQGYELQFATNYLAHFSLSAMLTPLLLDAGGARVVTVGSLSHSWRPPPLDDLHGERRYRPMEAYGQSKAACLSFAFELDRRLQRAGADVMSVAAHPGVTRTSLMRTGMGDGLRGRFMEFGSGVVGHSTERGALPILYAATGRNAKPGAYYGPRGFRGWRGAPRRVQAAPHSMDEDFAGRLWATAEELTGARFDALER